MVILNNMNDIRPFEEYKEIIEDTSKDKLIEFIYELLKEKQQLKEQIEYLRRSCERKEDTIIDLQEELSEINELKERIDKALRKIENMFDLGNEETIIDDLLELEKILKGEK